MFSARHTRARQLSTLAVLAAVLAGCQLDAAPSATPDQALPAAELPVGTVVASPMADATPAVSALQPATPAAAELPAQPVVAVRDGDRLRLEARAGQLGPPTWVGSDHVLVNWNAPGCPVPGATYLLDRPTGALRRLQFWLAPGQLVAGSAGTGAILLEDDGRLPELQTASLLDTCTAETQTIVSADPARPQWASASGRRWAFGAAAPDITATWTTTDTALLTLTPQDDRNIAAWGEVLLVDVEARRVRVLAEQGQVAAVLPDGALLLRPGWVDGPVQILAPPYGAAPAPVAAGGPWTAGWAVSPDGQRVAWLEAGAPPGDWSRRLPATCCGSRGCAPWPSGTAPRASSSASPSPACPSRI